MSLLLLDSADVGPAVQAMLAVDITADVTVAATVVEGVSLSIAVDITDDLSAAAYTPFIVPEPGCRRVAVITH